jgi:hypothetical protein
MPSFRVRRTLCRARIGQIRIRRPFSNDSTVRPLSQSLALDGFRYQESRQIAAAATFHIVVRPLRAKIQ